MGSQENVSCLWIFWDSCFIQEIFWGYTGASCHVSPLVVLLHGEEDSTLNQNAVLSTVCKGGGFTHWPTATSICVTVFECADVFKAVLLNSFTHSPRNSPPHPSISPPDRMTAHSALSNLNTQPAEVAINPSAGLLAHWVAPVRWLILVIFFSMRLLLTQIPTPGSSPPPLPLWVTHVYTSAVSQSKKRTCHLWNTEGS